MGPMLKCVLSVLVLLDGQHVQLQYFQHGAIDSTTIEDEETNGSLEVGLPCLHQEWPVGSGLDHSTFLLCHRGTMGKRNFVHRWIQNGMASVAPHMHILAWNT